MKFSAFYIKCMLLKITGRVLKIPGEKAASKEGRPGRDRNIAEAAVGCTPRQPKRVAQ